MREYLFIFFRFLNSNFIVQKIYEKKIALKIKFCFNQNSCKAEIYKISDLRQPDFGISKKGRFI